MAGDHLLEARWRSIVSVRKSQTENLQSSVLPKLQQILLVRGHVSMNRLKFAVPPSQFLDELGQKIVVEVVPVEIQLTKQLPVILTLAKDLVILGEKGLVLVDCNDGRQHKHHHFHGNATLLETLYRRLFHAIKPPMKPFYLLLKCGHRAIRAYKRNTICDCVVIYTHSGLLGSVLGGEVGLDLTSRVVVVDGSDCVAVDSSA